MPTEQRPPGTRRRRIAAALQLAQGLLMEGLPFAGLLALLVLGIEQSTVTDRAEIFALPFLQDNLYWMMAMSGIFAALRIVGAVGLLRDRLWGFALSLVNCVVTLALMIFMLPAGVLDGVLSGGALVLLLHSWFGDRRIGAPPSYAMTKENQRPTTDATTCRQDSFRPGS